MGALGVLSHLNRPALAALAIAAGGVPCGAQDTQAVLAEKSCILAAARAMPTAPDLHIVGTFAKSTATSVYVSLRAQLADETFNFAFDCKVGSAGVEVTPRLGNPK